MRMRMPFLAGVLCLAYAPPAFACNFYFHSTFMRIPAKPAFGGGMTVTFTDPTIWAFTGDYAMRLGDKLVVQPGVGFCTGGSDTDVIFGGGVAYRFMHSSTMTVNLQSGLSYASVSGGSQLIVPIGGAVSIKRSETMDFYGGASFWWSQVDFDEFESISDIDPVLFGGVQMNKGAFAWSLGGQMVLADAIEFGIVAGASMNTGIHGNAVRHLGSLFRK